MASDHSVLWKQIIYKKYRGDFFIAVEYAQTVSLLISFYVDLESKLESKKSTRLTTSLSRVLALPWLLQHCLIYYNYQLTNCRQ